MGLVVPEAEFERIVELLQQDLARDTVVQQAHQRHQGQRREQTAVRMKDPAGNTIEFRTLQRLQDLFVPQQETADANEAVETASASQEAEEELETLKGQLQKVETQRDRLKGYRDTCMQELKDTKAALQAASAQGGDSEEVAQLKEQLQKIETQRDRLKGYRDTCMQELKDTRKELADTKETSRAVSVQDGSTEEVEELRAKLQKVETQLDRLKGYRDTCMQELKDTRKELAETKELVHELANFSAIQERNILAGS